MTLVLKAIFKTEHGKYLLFKGGTALSKCWNLIDRFSEDIDLAVDRDIFGEVKEWTPTQIKKLKRKACEFTSTLLKDEIEKALIELGVPEGMTTITAAEVKPTMPDKDPQQLDIMYPSLIDPVDYLPDVVKIEVSARSLKEPWTQRHLSSMLDNAFPGRPWSGKAFQVPAVEPKRTFLEKCFLLAEEFQKKENIRHFRMSRHLYDLVKLMDIEHAASALYDNQLYDHIVKHREQFSFLSWVDYRLHSKETISFFPPASVLPAYEQDYLTMQHQMIYGDSPDFKEIMKKLEELHSRFRSGM